MRLTRRTWISDGLMYIEMADGHGQGGYYIDYLGRIGLEADDGTILWHVPDGARVYAVQRTERTSDVTAIDTLRVFGVEPGIRGGRS